VARLRHELKPVPIYDGRDLAPIHVDWLAISHIPEDANSRETFILYWLNGRGRPQEILEYDTLEIALDQAQTIAGINQDEWHSCAVVVMCAGHWDKMDLSHPINHTKS
jgi:hypothetical protein